MVQSRLLPQIQHTECPGYKTQQLFRSHKKTKQNNRKQQNYKTQVLPSNTLLLGCCCCCCC